MIYYSGYNSVAYTSDGQNFTYKNSTSTSYCTYMTNDSTRLYFNNYGNTNINSSVYYVTFSDLYDTSVASMTRTLYYSVSQAGNMLAPLLSVEDGIVTGIYYSTYDDNRTTTIRKRISSTQTIASYDLGQRGEGGCERLDVDDQYYYIIDDYMICKINKNFTGSGRPSSLVRSRNISSIYCNTMKIYNDEILTVGSSYTSNKNSKYIQYVRIVNINKTDFTETISEYSFDNFSNYLGNVFGYVIEEKE